MLDKYRLSWKIKKTSLTYKNQTKPKESRTNSPSILKGWALPLGKARGSLFLMVSQYTILYTMLSLISCKTNEQTFTYLTKNKTNIQFNNKINPTDEMNILDFHYLYNGGGVGIADFNNDGLPDILFGGNQVSSALYINKGNFQFELSDAIQTKVWVNGISIVDINNDGLKDVYLNVGGANCEVGQCKNKLLINTSTKNTLEFKEQAVGLEVDLYSQQTVFFDADHDGDLDAYMLQNYVDRTNKNYPKPKRYFSKKSYDKFFLNEEVETGKLFFKEVSEAWNINNSGFGLGVVLTDVNNDNYLDVYVANDFISDDLFYVNNKGKSFTESSKQLLKHTSYNSMGVDAADLNHDGFEEIMVVDMLPYTNARQKTMLGMMNYDKYKLSLKENFNPQYIRNTLQKHNQTNYKNENQAFTEIGAFSQVYQTDWSWAPLFADYNNDSKTDLYITNGYASNITDLDFVNYNNQTNPFGGKEAAKKEILQNLEKQGAVKLNNVYFEQTEPFKFTTQTETHFKNNPSLSNGAAYADLDLDGDLDLVVNNINQAAFIIQNNAGGNYLSIQLIGEAFNKDAIGTKVSLWSDGKMQQKLFAPIRGYLSSVEPMLHFGLGKMETIDSLVIFWYDGSVSKMNQIEANQILKINKADANSTKTTLSNNLSKNKLHSYINFILKDTLVKADSKPLPHDFSIQSLLQRQYSSKGFQITVSDNGQWLFVGSPKGLTSTLYKIEKDNSLQVHQQISDEEKTVFDAQFFDKENDGDEDLFIAYGGYQQPNKSSSYQNKIYINEGGTWTMELRTSEQVHLEDSIIQNNTMEHVPLGGEKRNMTSTNPMEPVLLTKKTHASSRTAANDYDKDGDVDFFIGSQIVPQNYPKIPASVFLQNNKGSFKNETEKILGETNLGLVQDAIWTDLNGDNWQDLVIVGEWMSPIIFINKEGKLNQQKLNGIDNLKGFWRCVYATDIDKDGDQDLVLGNFGTNNRLQASAKNPLQLVVGDLDKNGKHDPLMSFYLKDEQGNLKEYPYHTRDDLANQLPIIKSKYKNYSNYGKATFEEVLSHFDKANYELKKVNILESIVLENKGNLEFEVHILPNEMQWSSVNTIIEMDENQDSTVLLFGMNDNSLDSHIGKLDGKAVLALSVIDDFRFQLIDDIGIDGHSSVRSLWQVGDALFVGDEETVRVYELE